MSKGVLEGGRIEEPSSLTHSMGTARWMPYRLFPYEERLALRELDALGVRVIGTRDDTLEITGDLGRLAERTTYFASVALHDEHSQPTSQAAVEELHLRLRESPNGRQATRYGPHGLHEYKGKFNPQIVRAFCNVVDSDAEVLIDPFCGSGTSLVEGLRLGMRVVGIDRSPVAAYLASVKSEATGAASKKRTAEELRRLADRTARALERGQEIGQPESLHPWLDKGCVDYLAKWFTPPAFAAVSAGLATLNGARESTAQRLALAALSSLLREISLQLPADLRIRRRPEPFTAPPIAPRFLEAVAAIDRGLEEMSRWPGISAEWYVERGSAEDVAMYARAAGSRRRLIVTSPPYATALPYIDTDRLSAVALGLVPSTALLALERELIGSREWTRSEQHTWDERRDRNSHDLPDVVMHLLARIERLNSASEAGFRRQAVPSLLYRYFSRMADAMRTWHRVLEPGEAAVLIVGHNRTTAGGELVEIPTAELLGEVAEARGFRASELLKLETWPRYGLHSANGVAGEDALVITRPA